MAKDYKTLMRERRKGGGVPQIDPDDVVTRSTTKPDPVKAAALAPTPPSEDDPRRMTVDSGEPKTFQGWRLPAIRGRQIKYEAADKEIGQGEVVDRALDLYFKTHYPPRHNSQAD